MMLPRRVKKNFVRSSVVAPSKPLQGFSIRVSSSSIGRPGVSHNINGTVQLVSGLTLPPHHSSSITDTYPVEDKDSSQYPGYANKATRLQSFRDRGGITPPTELVDEGFFMVAPDVVKCCSCHVVVLGWKKKGIGSTSDIHCLHNSNCDFVKNCMQSEMQRANEFEDYTASQPVHVVNEVSSRNSLYSEKPVIKNRMKEGSRSTLLRPTMMVDRIPPHSIEYITPGVWYPPNQPSASQSVSRHGYVPKGSSTKSSYDVMATPSREQIILSERRIFEEGYNVIDTADDDKARVVQVACKVCWINQVDCVFLPCGHARACKNCARKIFNSGQPCHICNRTVGRVHPMYL